MTAPFAGLALRYLIGFDGQPSALAGHVVEVPFEQPPSGSPSIAYGNLLDQHEDEDGNPVRDCGPYLTPTGTAKQYEEGVPDPKGPGFAKNVTEQCALARSQGHTHIELDNPDDPHFSITDVIAAMLIASGNGLRNIAKNPYLLGGDSITYVRNITVDAMIVEDDAGTAAQNHAIRVAAGKPDLMVWFVYPSKVGRGAADSRAAEIRAHNFFNMGVTFDRSPKEYGGDVIDVLLPMTAAQPASTAMPTTASPTPWLADEIADAAVHKYSDGSDVPMLAAAVARAFPNVPGFADYCAEAGPDTQWCGIYQAFNMSRYGIMPPFGARDVDKFMYVDAWMPWGAAVAAGQQQPGDVALWINKSGLHHIAMLTELPNKYVGGNQGNTVSETTFPAPSMYRRPPPPVLMPALATPATVMKGSKGADVTRLQTMLIGLGFDVGPDGADGDFGDNTETAVSAYQTSRGLEVDGIAGTETWGSLLGTGTVPSPIIPGSLPAAAVDAVIALANASPIAGYAWKDRGPAPIGYARGMAVSYAKNYRDLKQGKSSALAMARPVGSSNTDAVAWYGLNPSGNVACLRATFQILWGLGPRESGGNPFVGVDTTNPSSTTADTAEAGLFQQSWNSHAASPELPKLFAEWKANPGDGFLSIFRQGVSGGPSASIGSGDGFQFQTLCKTKPEFAVECAAIGLRVLRSHWGPIINRAAELRPEVLVLFAKIEAVVDALPIDGDVLPPIVGPPVVPPAVPAAADPTQMLLLLLAILLKGKTMSDPATPGLPPGLDLNALIAALQGALAPPPAPPPPPPVAPAPAATPDLAAMIAALAAALARSTAASAPVAAPIQAPTPQIAPPVVSVAPEPASPAAAPVPSPVPGSVQAAAWALVAGVIGQLTGYIGTPFGMGQAPTAMGTITTVAPILLAGLGMTGALGPFERFASSFVSALKARPPQ